MRTTVQRKVILDQLGKHTDHPGAEAIYTEVREILPRISLGTVYRNLDVLAAKGLIRRLNFGRDHAHYDPNPIVHPHFLCNECHSVLDLHWKDGAPPDWMSFIHGEDLESATVESGSLLLAGVCEECSRHAVH